jgi:hypothetical protein
LNITDSVIYTYLLKEGEYTTPIPTFRYLYRKFFTEHFGHSYYGIDNDFKGIVDTLFDPEKKQILMSYVRTTPFREPIRVEFFNIYNKDYKKLIGATYFLSLFYQSYGIPIVLYYVDKIARTPKRLVETVIRAEVMDVLLGKGFQFQDILKIFGDLKRNFFKR